MCIPNEVLVGCAFSTFPWLEFAMSAVSVLLEFVELNGKDGFGFAFGKLPPKLKLGKEPKENGVLFFSGTTLPLVTGTVSFLGVKSKVVVVLVGATEAVEAPKFKPPEPPNENGLLFSGARTPFMEDFGRVDKLNPKAGIGLTGSEGPTEVDDAGRTDGLKAEFADEDTKPEFIGGGGTKVLPVAGKTKGGFVDCVIGVNVELGLIGVV